MEQLLLVLDLVGTFVPALREREGTRPKHGEGEGTCVH